MLLRNEIVEGVASGRVTLAFRRWRRPSIKAGGRLRTTGGEMAIEALDQIRLNSITESEARKAGFGSLEELVAELKQYREGKFYRIELRMVGPDPRLRLGETNTLSMLDIQTIDARLAKYDRSSPVGPWTKKMLKLISRYPEVSAEGLAKKGGFEKQWLKVQVRRLKDLGLTISRMPGYRLSPRGRAYLAQLGRED